MTIIENNYLSLYRLVHARCREQNHYLHSYLVYRNLRISFVVSTCNNRIRRKALWSRLVRMTIRMDGKTLQNIILMFLLFPILVTVCACRNLICFVQDTMSKVSNDTGPRYLFFSIIIFFLFFFFFPPLITSSALV